MKLIAEEIFLVEYIKQCKPFDEYKPIDVYEIGGCVRDRLMGKENKDIDILVCNVSYNELKNTLSTIAKVTSTSVGDSMNVLKVNFMGIDFDISIPRTEVYDGSNTHNGVVTFGDPSLPLEADQSRRDFRINSIALDLSNFKYKDTFNGKKDIEDKLICFVGNPVERIKEDPLRILRAIQFSIRFGFKIEENSWNAILDNSHLLHNITSERILEELRKAFEKNNEYSNKIIVHYILNIHYFFEVFGWDFSPIVSNIFGNKFISNMVLLFADGGDYSVLKLDNKTIQIIELVRRMYKECPFEVMWKKRHLYQDVAFSVIGIPSINTKFSTLQNIPIAPNELKISSEELMHFGYTGIELGKIQKELCHKIYNKELINDNIVIRKYLDV